MTELLSPAGNLEALKAAVDAGADAVYIGGNQFSARAFADNPDSAGLIEGIEYCHLRGRRLYLTVNTLLKEEEIREELAPFLDPLYEHGLDAVLVQDFGVLRFLRERYPSLKLHASTQMSVTTPEGAALLARHGVSRVVPARELSLEEIRQIVRSGMETETFIHGALCYCYSGRCLMSSMLGGRSGNRGRCAQPCRLPYNDNEFLLSMKDLCTLDLLPDLTDAGIASFKIEGRRKQPAYTAGVTAIYRKYMDLYQEKGRPGYQIQEEDRQKLLDLFNRGGFSGGYYRKKNGPDMIEKKRSQANRKRPGEPLKQENSKVKINGELRISRHSPVILEVWPAHCEQGGDCSVKVSTALPSEAKHAALTIEELDCRIRKTGETPFVFDSLKIDLEEGLFVPMGSLNALRRSALEQLRERMLGKWVRQTPIRERKEPEFRSAGEHVQPFRKVRFTVLVTLPEQLSSLLSWISKGRKKGRRDQISTVYLDSMLLGTKKDLPASCAALAGQVERLHGMQLSCFFYAPPVLRKEGKEIFRLPCVRKLLRKMDGFLVQTIDELAFFRQERADAVFAAEDCLYTFNSDARQLLRAEGISRFTYPAELTARELACQKSGESELILYGYQALMQSAQCLQKNTSGCTGVPGIHWLTDRKHIRFPVLNRCLFCTNTIYNSVPLKLIVCEEKIRDLFPSYLRLSFTVESQEETEKILQLFLLEQGQTHEADGTRGHFKRGVE